MFIVVGVLKKEQLVIS